MRRFHAVDVFAGERFAGNPLAVVHDAEGLTAEAMQRITRWMNLSETVFLLPPSTPDADYRVRIFTLAHELPFAGHPTLGACHAWLATGGTAGSTDRAAGPDRFVQECGGGLVPLRRDGTRLAFAAPPVDTFTRFGPVEDHDLAELTATLDLSPQQVVDAHWVDNGPGWVALLLDSAASVLGVTAPTSHPGPLDVGLVAPALPDADHRFEVRALFSDGRGGVLEDFVTGSLNAGIAQWLLDSGRASAPYVARQGTRLGRTGRVHVDRDDDGRVWVGGEVHTVVEGRIWV